MQIGIVAKKIGLSVDAIRFYERNGLLPRPSRMQGGFRRYSDTDVGNRCLCSSCAGVAIHTQRDSRPAETARESLAALCAGTTAASKKSSRMCGGDSGTFRS
jgi:DNA-binding transcriptional MerR regulator